MSIDINNYLKIKKLVTITKNGNKYSYSHPVFDVNTGIKMGDEVHELLLDYYKNLRNDLQNQVGGLNAIIQDCESLI